MARWSFEEFAEEVERAEAEVRPEFPPNKVQVIARSVGAVGWGNGLPYPPWGEFYPPNGPIVLYQWAFENSEPPAEGMEHQVREVLRHELHHFFGMEHGPKLIPREAPSVSSEWYEDTPLDIRVGDVLVRLP